MSHITQEQALLLQDWAEEKAVEQLGSAGEYHPDEWKVEAHLLCNAAIQHYIDRAALAQPEPVSPARALMDVTIEDEAAKMLRDYLVQEGDDEPSPVRFLLGDGHSGHGLYLAAAEYPEEGAILLAAVAQPAEPVTDPCPGCRPGGVCRTPTCGRLALPVDHPLRVTQPEPVSPASDEFLFISLLEAAEQEPHATPRLVNACRSVRAAAKGGAA